jgi:ectoine hydroxylase-related dioxygenase (phytanoyl-CoA dioxygenase family)
MAGDLTISRAAEELAVCGFTVRPRLVDEAVVEQLRTAYDEILDHTVTAQGDRMLGGLTRQVMAPSQAHPVFDRNAALDAAAEIASEFFGRVATRRSFDMLIDKPAGHRHETPWHQDLAYAQRPTAPAGYFEDHQTLQFWIALDDADVENGCMQFIPGQHREPLLEHRVVSGDPDDEGRLLGLVDPAAQLDLSAAVVGAIPAGGCTVHLPTTPHYTGPNRTADRRRRAYIVNIGPA